MILEILGVPAPPGIQGKSLLSGASPKSAVFAEFPTTHAVRTREWKLVHYQRAKLGEFYDLNNDPHELHNLWDDPGYAKRRGEVQGLLFDWQVTSRDPLLAPVTG